MIGFLVGCIIAVLLLALLWFALGLLPVPENVRLIVLLIVALLVVLYLARHFGLF